MKKIFIFLITFGLFTTSNLSAQLKANILDSIAIVNLYDSTNGINWIDNFNWLTPSPLKTWIKVSLGVNNNNRINQLSLMRNNLSGTIPFTLENLDSLQLLYLFKNNLTGTIPPTIGNLTALLYLNLDVNQLTGSIPSSLGKLKNLQVLTLNNNNLSGAIPDSIGKLTKINYLTLNYNNLSGNIPSSLGNLTNLTTLALQNNKFTFSGLEFIAQKFSFATYAPQAIVPLTFKKIDTTLSVSVGGTPANNTFKWYNSGTLVASKKSDSTYRPTSNGVYYVAATNAIATKLTLYSDSTIINYPTNTADSLALVDLYNSTGGANWTKHTNWLTKLPVNSWYGVTENDWRVIGISLAANNLNGALPTSLGNLPYLTTLALQNNKLTFSGLEIIAKKYSFASYAPQAIIPLKQLGSTLSFSVGGTPANDTFRWYKNGILVATKTGDSNYSITSNGKYWASATNTMATKLTLNSDTINFTTLPIKDIWLSATATNGQVQLQWQTKGEENTLTFIIQRSNDGSVFTDLAAKKAVGSGAKNYAYIDVSDVLGARYYRIKSIDKEGNINYSNVSFLSLLASSNQLIVFPNPVLGNSFNLKIDNATVGKYAIHLVNALGQTVYATTLYLYTPNGLEAITISERLAAGSYIITASSDDGTILKTQVIIK